VYPRLIIFLGIKIYFLGMKNYFFGMKKMDMLHLSAERYGLTQTAQTFAEACGAKFCGFL
jgi:hypothetical protein